MMQMTNKVSVEIFEEMLEAAKAACLQVLHPAHLTFMLIRFIFFAASVQIFELLQPAVRENTLKLLNSRSSHDQPLHPSLSLSFGK
jgi:hypothetical protein